MFCRCVLNDAEQHARCVPDQRASWWNSKAIDAYSILSCKIAHNAIYCMKTVGSSFSASVLPTGDSHDPVGPFAWSRRPLQALPFFIALDSMVRNATLALADTTAGWNVWNRLHAYVRTYGRKVPVLHLRYIRTKKSNMLILRGPRLTKLMGTLQTMIIYTR
jgi:hypothetical protein